LQISDYLYDNLECRSLSQLSQSKRKHYFFFYLFEERICRVDFPHAFQDWFLIEILIPIERFLVPASHGGERLSALFISIFIYAI
jgi:hypothetical protein